jgi:hypothetical protein
MGMIIQPESALGIEMAKWEKNYVFVPYPRMMYRAIKVDGKHICMMPQPSQFGWRDVAEYQSAILQAEQITKSNQRIVQNEQEERRACDEGWRVGPQEALDHLEAVEQEIGKAAAEANWGARRMGEGARREHSAATDSTHEHVVDVKPKRKYTRKSKAAPVAVTGSGEVAEMEG